MLFLINCGEDSQLVEEDVGFPGGGSNPVELVDKLPIGRVDFDVSPIDLSGVLIFEPMGSVGTFPKDHGGFHHNQVGIAEPNLGIYALADGVATGLGKDVDDYWIQIRYSTTVSVKLGHIGRFHQSILDESGPFTQGEVKNINIGVRKGQLIGYVSSLGALDMGLHDLEIENSFCYPELYGFELRYASNIFDYFNEPIKSELLTKAIREVSPRGGKVDFDVKGTLAGNWFLQGGATQSFENHFAIAYDYLHPERVIIYNGYAEFVENDFTYNHTWIKNNAPPPETIDLAHGVVKYEMISKRGWRRDDGINFTLDLLDGVDEQTPRGTILFEMLDNETMQVEYFPEQLASDVSGFSGNQRIYVRNP